MFHLQPTQGVASSANGAIATGCFQRLGEEATIEVTKQRNAIGFAQNKKAARDGGASAGDARKAYENRIGTKVVSADNFLKNKEIIIILKVINL